MDKRSIAEYIRLYNAVKKYGYNNLNADDKKLFKTLYELQTGKLYEPISNVYASSDKPQASTKKADGSYHIKMVLEHNPHKAAKK